MSNNPKILIISSDTGGGHRSAAKSLADGLEKFWHGDSSVVRIVKAVEESHHITDKLVGVYNWMLRNRQHWMKYLYWCVNRFRPETREFFHRRSIGFVRDLFERWCPHVVVSVHPLTQHIFARILKELKLAEQIPLVTVVTDPCYGFWKGWACDDVSLYLVANDEARRQLLAQQRSGAAQQRVGRDLCCLGQRYSAFICAAKCIATVPLTVTTLRPCPSTTPTCAAALHSAPWAS